MEKKRILYLDYMRVTALFAVILLHVSVIDWSKFPINSFNWQVFNAFDGLVRFCVPVFVMISGVFFLDKYRDITLKKLFSHNILRIATAFVFWSVLYAVVCTIVEENNMIDGSVIKYFIASVIYGHYHMWFLFTIVGLYLITPFLRKITADKKLTEYFIVLSVIFANLPKILVFIPALDEVAGKILYKTNMFFVLGYAGYFVLGHYLHTYEIKREHKLIAYALGTVSVIATIAGNSYMSLKAGIAQEAFFDYMMPTVLFSSVMVFLLFKDRADSFEKGNKSVIVSMSKLTFGMYLIHDLFIIAFKNMGLSTVMISPIVAIPLVAVIIFVLSYLCVFILNKIPVINKYII